WGATEARQERDGDDGGGRETGERAGSDDGSATTARHGPVDRRGRAVERCHGVPQGFEAGAEVVVAHRASSDEGAGRGSRRSRTRARPRDRWLLAVPMLQPISSAMPCMSRSATKRSTTAVRCWGLNVDKTERKNSS